MKINSELDQNHIDQAIRKAITRSDKSPFLLNLFKERAIWSLIHKDNDFVLKLGVDDLETQILAENFGPEDFLALNDQLKDDFVLKLGADDLETQILAENFGPEDFLALNDQRKIIFFIGFKIAQFSKIYHLEHPETISLIRFADEHNLNKDKVFKNYNFLKFEKSMEKNSAFNLLNVAAEKGLSVQFLASIDKDKTLLQYAENLPTLADDSTSTRSDEDSLPGSNNYFEFEGWA